MDTVFSEMQKSLQVSRDAEKFADLVITVNSGRDNECIYLFELKYITKSDATESKIQKTVKEATDQVQRYKSALDFRDRQVKAYAMIFVGSDCVYCG
jgi:DNA integrity scanning protein DisA with diadenylate cyclase activity